MFQVQRKRRDKEGERDREQEGHESHEGRVPHLWYIGLQDHRQEIIGIPA